MVRVVRGFSLIELMIVVAITAIIIGIAYPSYLNSVRKSNRAEAKAELVDLAQRLQRCFTTYGRFEDPQDRCTVYEDLTDGTNVISRGQGFYEITIDGVTAVTYRLVATAIKEPQTSDDGERCNVLTLDQRGEKQPEVCW